MYPLSNSLPLISSQSDKLTYWKKKLEGISTLELPTDYLRTPLQSTHSAEIHFTIDKALLCDLQRLSNQQGVTLFMTLLSAFKILLNRYSGQEDICVGSLIANGTRMEAQEQVGHFVNTLVLRSEVNSNNNFIEFLQQVKVNTLEAYEHQEVPFEKVVDAVIKEKDPSRNPLFQVMFVMHNVSPISNFGLAEREVSTEDYELDTSKFDLTFIIKETALGLKATMAYCTDLFSESTIKRMVGHYKELLASIVKQPNQKIGLLSMLTASEEHQLLVEFNHTVSEYSKEKTIIDLFEEQAARTPEATAIVFKEKKLTYKELNEKANQLAHYLRSKGVMEKTLVPICIERSLEMIIGILGILKAGGAYVPIDVDYPLDRINFMLKDTGATIVVSSQQSSSKLQTSATVELIELDPDLRVINTQPIENLQIAVQPHNVAYVIYTSGSTGKPKGVMIEHASIVNYLVNSKTRYIKEKQGGSGSFIHLSYTFDASLTAMFMPLLSGKKVIIGSQQALLIFEDSNLWKYAPYDFIKITPSHLELLSPILENVNGDLLTNKLVIGGEALHLSQFDYLVEKGMNVEVINEYGPTEATVGCSTYHFHTLGDNEKLKNNISIGKPIDNLQLYILNSQNELLPVGVMGELCIGGKGVARGYLNRPDLTSQKFIQNPFNSKPGSRIYKTGDLCRWDANGSLEYLGRKDDQVKIRGYRIELGEIESALNQHPGLQQVAVMARKDSPNNKSLVAYVVTKSEQVPLISDLQHFLSDKLPVYMLPSAFVFLKSLPLTSNGKINRSALPAPAQQKRELGNTFVAAGNPLELKLKKIYEESLNIHSIGVQDNFFDLGGDSMHAVQIFSKIRKTFGKQLPLAILFQAPTIKQLALYIKSEGLITSWSSLVPIQPKGTKPPLFCMHAGAGTVLFYKSLSLHLGEDQPLYGLQAKGLNGNESPLTRIEDMAAHFIKEIRTVQPKGPYLLGGYCFGAMLAFEMVQQLIHQNDDVALLANFNGVSPTYTTPSQQIIAEENDFEDSSGILPNVGLKKKIVHLLNGLISHKLRSKIKKLLYNYYIFRNRPLPEALGKRFFLETNADIVRGYKPKPYTGKMIIFRSPGIYSDPHLGWDGLINGGIETCDIPGQHQNRREIMNEPFVQHTAEKLKIILELSQSNYIIKSDNLVKEY